MRIHNILWLMVGIVFLLSCSASQFGWKAEDDMRDQRATKSGFIEDFDPLSLDDDDIVVTPDQKPTPEAEDEKPQPAIQKPIQEKSTPEIVQGFRVQLLATGDESQAREAQKSAIFRFEEGVYLAFEPPLYKLRIGDCRTRKEAEELRQKAIRNGFDDAWIVPSKIQIGKGDQSIR
jgi:hypothetical protein